MHPLIEQHREQISALCRQYGVSRLEAFGSILREDFDPANSDVDVLIEFDGSQATRRFDHYLGFKQSLERLFGRPVDVIESSALRNRRLQRHIALSKQPVYATA